MQHIMLRARPESLDFSYIKTFWVSLSSCWYGWRADREVPVLTTWWHQYLKAGVTVGRLNTQDWSQDSAQTCCFLPDHILQNRPVSVSSKTWKTSQSVKMTILTTTLICFHIPVCLNMTKAAGGCRPRLSSGMTDYWCVILPPALSR